MQVQHRRPFGDLVDGRTAVVHHPERLAVLPAGVAGSLLHQVGDDVVDVTAVLWKVHGDIVPRRRPPAAGRACGAGGAQSSLTRKLATRAVMIANVEMPTTIVTRATLRPSSVTGAMSP